jgi:hypothetical protein
MKKIPAKKLIVITIIGALITVTLEKIGVYDAIVKAIS